MKKMQIFIIILIVVVVLSIFLIIGHSKSILYETTYSFAFGTRSVKIYKDGDVYDDLEIEEPNHKAEYKYLKTLNEEEKNGLADLIKTKASKEIIDEYVIKSVYGVEKFDNYGSY